MQRNWITRLEIISIVDNFNDLLLIDDGPAKRRPSPKRAYERCLCSEHGFAQFVTSYQESNPYRVLFDFGATPLVYLHNLQLLLEDYSLNLKDVDSLVLSHGHFDHHGGLVPLLDQRRSEFPTRLSLYAGEDAFMPRKYVMEDGTTEDMGFLDEHLLRSHQVVVVPTKHSQLLGDQAWSSGEIKRTTSYETVPSSFLVGDENEEKQDQLVGEQALIYLLKDRGLIVLTACGHAGVVNTVMHAQKITGVDKVHAIVGGFHLSGAPSQKIADTVEGLGKFNPDIIVPMHCTGLPMIEALRNRFGSRVIYNTVGTQYVFE